MWRMMLYMPRLCLYILRNRRLQLLSPAHTRMSFSVVGVQLCFLLWVSISQPWWNSSEVLSDWRSMALVIWIDRRWWVTRCKWSHCAWSEVHRCRCTYMMARFKRPISRATLFVFVKGPLDVFGLLTSDFRDSSSCKPPRIALSDTAYVTY